jgi:hypothetical protein
MGTQLIAAAIFALAIGCHRTPSTHGPDDPDTGKPPCPDGVLESGAQQGGTCMEPGVLGDAVVTTCEGYLQQQGWQRDPDAEQHIGRSNGKTLVCLRRPGPSAAP